MLDSVVIAGKSYRKGYTTGSCAAAAAKAATCMLLKHARIEHITIDTPAGIVLTLPISDVCIQEHAVTCAVIKDGGDDPDVTTGLKIFVRASKIQTAEVIISAGEGIGTVTQKGLLVAVGEPAINPVPRQMILQSVKSVLPAGQGVQLHFWVPNGEEVARLTYNPRLGILGGISILGTKGIVEPMSEDAWKQSLALALSQLAANGVKKAIFVFGNYGEDYVKAHMDVPPQYMIKMSNFVGFMLDKAVELRFEQVLIVGHLGKLVKLAGGIFHTHSRMADARMEILVAHAALCGASGETVRHVFACKTTQGAVEVLNQAGLTEVLPQIVRVAAEKASQYTFNKLKVGCILVSESGQPPIIEQNAQEMLAQWVC
ncbi:MAG: cobalamin biosynthesis protein CbiD [Hyphomonadaceae bacterium]|nr:cobalamin biosynthesis protein CbiD [Clostridia bacterium]